MNPFAHNTYAPMAMSENPVFSPVLSGHDSYSSSSSAAPSAATGSVQPLQHPNLQPPQQPLVATV